MKPCSLPLCNQSGDKSSRFYSLLCVAFLALLIVHSQDIIAAFGLNLGAIAALQRPPVSPADTTLSVQSAHRFLTWASRVDTSSAGPLILLGKLYLFDDQPDMAKECLTASLSRQSNNRQAAFWLAQIYHAQGETVNAIRWWRVAQTGPQFLQKADLIAPDDPAGGASLYRLVVLIDPESKAGWYGLAVAQERLSQWSEAHQAYERAASLEAPGTVDQRQAVALSHIMLARAYQAEENHFAALEEYAEAARLSSEPDIYYEWGKAALKSGDQELAISVLRKYVRRVPDTLGGRTALGLIFFDKGDMAQARHWYMEAAQLYPNASLPQRGLGLVAYKEGNWPEAEQRFRNALSEAPDSDAAHYYLGKSLEAQGRYHEALPELQITWRLRRGYSYATSLYLLACRLGQVDVIEEVGPYIAEQWPDTWEWVYRDCRNATRADGE